MPKKNKTAPAREVSHERQDEAFVERQSAGDDSSVPAQASTRLSLPLNSEGTIDWDRARESQKDKFTSAVLNSPETLEMIGLAAGADGAQQQGWSEDSIRFGLDTIASITGFVFGRLSKKVIGTQIDADISGECFQFSDEKRPGQKHTDYETLVPPTQRIADRTLHVDPKYQDVVLLLTGLTAIVGRQAQNALAMQGERDEKKKPQGDKPTIHSKPVTIRPTSGAQS